MAKSEAFARIKDQVLRIVATIPESKITTYQSIGEHLSLMPRHVAYILSQLDDNTKLDIPWYRVVSADGSLGVPKRDPNGDSQAQLLQRGRNRRGRPCGPSPAGERRSPGRRVAPRHPQTGAPSGDPQHHETGAGSLTEE